MKFKVNILETNEEIYKKINDIIAQRLKTTLPLAFENSTTFLQKIIIENLKKQPEYESLLNGSLKHQFGIPDPDNRLEEILSQIINSLTTTYKKPTVQGSRIQGGFTINMVKGDFSDLLDLSSAKISTEKGTELEWLRWLLLEGDSSIVIGYDFISGFGSHSRTGDGIMRGNHSGIWRVPPEFSGSLTNNWIIRGIIDCGPEIDRYLISMLKNLL